jgi:hypothetical protein
MSNGLNLEIGTANESTVLFLYNPWTLLCLPDLEEA